jgi:hypothetical protein
METANVADSAIGGTAAAGNINNVVCMVSNLSRN